MQFVDIFRLVLVASGLLVCWWAIGRRHLSSLLRRTPIVTTLDASTGEIVALAGTVVVDDENELVDLEHGDGNAVVAAWRTEEYRRDYGTTIGTKGARWDTISKGYRSTPFHLEGDAGGVLVDPAASVENDARGIADTGVLGNSVTDGQTIVSFASFEEHKPKSFDVTAAEVAGASGQRNGVNVPFLPGPNEGERRHEQATIEPGDDVFVLGRVERTDASVDGTGDHHGDRDSGTGDHHGDRDSGNGDHHGDRVVDATAPGPFVLSDRGRTELLVHASLWMVAFAFGVLVLAVAVAM